MKIRGIKVEAFNNVVGIKGGRFFLVTSSFDFDDGCFKTAVYKSDIDGNITDLEELYVNWWDTREEMRQMHADIAFNLTDFLEGVI